MAQTFGIPGPRVKQFKPTLTLALSHRMGEGVFADASIVNRPARLVTKTYMPAPSPIRWEKAGVRVTMRHSFALHLQLQDRTNGVGLMADAGTCR